MSCAATPSSRLGNAWIVASVWLFLYASFALVSPPLLNGVDGLHAEMAREMMVRDDPITLYANGIRTLQEAPLLYWSMAISMRVFGVGTVAARLPLALTALLLSLLVERFARHGFRSERAGLYAGAGLLLSPGLFLFTRVLIPEPISCLWLAAAIACFWQTETGLQEHSGKAALLPCLGYAAACAANLLTVGLSGLVFPLGTVLLYLLMTRGIRGTMHRIGQFHAVASLCTFLVLAAPWHVLAALGNLTEGHPAALTHAAPLLPWFWRGWQAGQPAVGNVHGWAWAYFLNGQPLRPDLRLPTGYDTVPPWLFWSLFLVWTLPWSAFLFKAMGAVPWRVAWWRRPLSQEGKLLLLLGVSAVVPLAFFPFSTQDAYHVVPALPFLAMLIARWLDREATEAESLAIPAPLPHAGQRAATWLLVCGAVVALACAFLLLRFRAASPGIGLSLLLHRDPVEHARSFMQVLLLTAAATGPFRRPILLLGAASFLGALTNWRARRNYQPHRGNVALTLGTAGFLTAAHMALTIVSPMLTSQRLAAAIAPRLRPSDVLVVQGEYAAASTLGFYLERDTLHILPAQTAPAPYGSFFSDAPPIFETGESLARRWSGPGRVFLWTDPVNVPVLPSKAYGIAEADGMQILSNRQSSY